MKNKVSLKELLENLKKSGLVRESIPLGFGPGLPMIQIKNKKVCLVIPYFGFVRVNAIDQSRILPIRYAITVLWPSGKIIKFEDLSFHPAFSKVDFSKPVGLFRHDAIKQYNSGEYYQKRDELLGMYDELIDFLVNDADYSIEKENEFKELLNIIMEPSLKPIYKALDLDFYNKFID